MVLDFVGVFIACFLADMAALVLAFWLFTRPRASRYPTVQPPPIEVSAAAPVHPEAKL